MNQRKKQLSWAALRVGLMVTAAIAVIFLAVLFAGNMGIFTSRETLHAAFDDVKGLRPMAPVWISGVQVGTVRSIHFTPENIKVTMSVDRTIGLLGDIYIDIMEGSREAPAVKPGETLAGSAEPGINEQVEGIIDVLQSRKGTIGRLLEEDALYRDVSDVLRDVKQFLDRLETSKGTVNDLITDRRLYENVNAAAAKLNAVLDKINTGQGAAGSLIVDEELKRELHSTLKEVNELVKDIRRDPKKYFKFSVF